MKKVILTLLPLTFFVSLTAEAAIPVNVNRDFINIADNLKVDIISQSPYLAKISTNSENIQNLKKFGSVTQEANWTLSLSEKGYWGQCVGLIRRTSDAKTTGY